VRAADDELVLAFEAELHRGNRIIGAALYQQQR
jgi:hypothetical protein